jgi:alpha-methylacyl-CoA racemase
MIPRREDAVSTGGTPRETDGPANGQRPANGAAAGPLAALRVVEFAGKGPAPFAAMLLSDLGAQVLRVERVPAPERHPDYRVEHDLLRRGRADVGIDLKTPPGLELALELISSADVLIEGYRPGVMEKLGLGPDVCLARNPRLVYGRATGWGQTGPLAAAAGHDINFLAVSGVLSMLGRAGGPPTPPANILGDFGGGGMLVAVGVLAAALAARTSGRGQVVDASILEGSVLLATLLYGLRAAGQWSDERGTNLLDTGAPYYDVYETADRRWMAVGAVEPRFYHNLLRALGLDSAEFPNPADRSAWPRLRERLTAVFRSRTQAEWVERLSGVDACASPVLTPDEAAVFPHNVERGVYARYQGVTQPAPAPKFSATPGRIPEPAAGRGNPLAGWGVAADRLETLAARGVIVRGG